MWPLSQSLSDHMLVSLSPTLLAPHNMTCCPSAQPLVLHDILHFLSTNNLVFNIILLSARQYIAWCPWFYHLGPSNHYLLPLPYSCLPLNPSLGALQPITSCTSLYHLLPLSTSFDATGYITLCPPVHHLLPLSSSFGAVIPTMCAPKHINLPFKPVTWCPSIYQLVLISPLLGAPQYTS